MAKSGVGNLALDFSREIIFLLNAERNSEMAKFCFDIKKLYFLILEFPILEFDIHD